MNGYELSRKWFNFCFENPDKITPSHSAIYFFAIEHCNRLGWKKKFGFPTTMVMEAVGIKSYNTYKKVLNDLVNFGFIDMIEISKNQYSSNIIALSNFNKALDKALDKALTKHLTKQSESTIQSIVSINKQETIEQYNHFYENQISSNADGKNIILYKQIIDFLQGSKDRVYSNVLAMEDQLKYSEFESLMSNYSPQQIIDTLKAMENYNKLKNNKSVYLTCNNWLRRDNVR